MACRAEFSKMSQKHGSLHQPEYACRHDLAKVLAEQQVYKIEINPHASRE